MLHDRDGQYADDKRSYDVGKVVGRNNANGSCKDNEMTDQTSSAAYRQHQGPRSRKGRGPL